MLVYKELPKLVIMEKILHASTLLLHSSTAFLLLDFGPEEWRPCSQGFSSASMAFGLQAGLLRYYWLVARKL